ncbi:lipopolysaccharide biosynthesis protein [Flagellimonas allohymeniacidonis]|uniref:lipopolysaccharide biosynthesis protein n=1 Tax=Flagellimonas allohymeniacidonis TaxID=2517819 RepID=UPI0013EED8BF|nr:oligosaccharide flippase family protein [Allomuricauda hymeniacidonis]
MKLFKTAIFKKIFYNAGILASGSVTSSIIGLVSFALIARILEAELFGVLALVQAYALIIDKILNFQSWQALIKYGSETLKDDRKEDLTSLLRLGFSLDVGTAILASVTGCILAYVVGYFLGWSDLKAQMASLFSIAILFNIEGTPTAILRLFNSFKHFAIGSVGAAILKLVLVVIGYYLESGLIYFVIVTMLSQIGGYIYLILSSLSLLNKKKIGLGKYVPNYKEIKNTANSFEGLKSFIWTTNLHGTVRMATLNLDVILVDTLLGSVATGLYKVAKQFAKIFTQFSQPLYKSIYPELARLWSENKTTEFASVIKKFSFITFIFGIIALLCFVVFGEDIIYLTVGENYLGSLPTLLWYLCGAVLSMTAFPITPAVLAMGYPRISFKVLLLSTLLYFSFFFFLVEFFGLQGAGISYLLLYIFWSIIMTFYYYKYLRKEVITNKNIE